LFVSTVTDFSAAEKARGVKFCMHIGLLSGQVFFLLEIKGQRSRSPGQKNALSAAKPHPASVRMVCKRLQTSAFLWRARGDIGGGVQRGLELGPAASTKAVWWDLHLASVLMDLLSLFVCLSVC